MGSNSGSLWRVISERAHWFGELGEGHVWTHRRERGKAKGWGKSCMYVWQQTWKCSAPQESLQNIHPFPLLVLKVLSRCLWALLCLFCCGPNNNSYSFIKVPKGWKCGSCLDFPLPVIILGCCQFLREDWLLKTLEICGMVNYGIGCSVVWEPTGITNHTEFIVGSLLVQGSDN